MGDQLGFASLDFAAKKKRTKRDVFLAEMAAVVPWDALVARIAPHSPKLGPQGGRRPYPLSTMLRIYCQQHKGTGGRHARQKRGRCLYAHLRNLCRLQARSKPQRHTGSVAIRAAKNCVTSITPCITVSTRASSCQRGSSRRSRRFKVLTFLSDPGSPEDTRLERRNVTRLDRP
jgi:hypothetical protein